MHWCNFQAILTTYLQSGHVGPNRTSCQAFKYYCTNKTFHMYIYILSHCNYILYICMHVRIDKYIKAPVCCYEYFEGNGHGFVKGYTVRKIFWACIRDGLK